MIKLILLLILPLSMLTACKENLTYDYLVQHPIFLKQKVDECQQSEMFASDKAAQCAKIMQAANQVESMIEDQQRHPEAFGQQVLDLQIACVNAQQQLQSVQQTLTDLQHTKTSSADDLKVAQAAVEKAKLNYLEQQKAIKSAYAVLGLSTPG